MAHEVYIPQVIGSVGPRVRRKLPGIPGYVLGFNDKSELASIPASAPGTSLEYEITGISASEHINQYQVATIQGKPANSDLVSSYGKVIGVSLESINIGFVGNVVTFGPITNSGWNWTTGDIIYLNGTSLSSTPPSSGFLQVIGVAKNATTIFVGLRDPILI